MCRERCGGCARREPQGEDPEVRQLLERDGNAKHRGIHRVGFDNGAVHPRWVAPERHAGGTCGTHDHLPVAALDGDEQAAELQETIRAEGERSALAQYAGIGEDHPLVDLVVERLDRIRR